MIEQKLFPRWFSVWFYISCLVFFAGGVVNRLTGVPDEGLNLWGAAIGVFVMYLITLFMWRRKESLQAFVAKISLPLAAKSVLVGWFFAEIDELINFPFNPLFPWYISISGYYFHHTLLLTGPSWLVLGFKKV